MSGDERESVGHALKAVNGEWLPPVRVMDLAEGCCKAHQVDCRRDRPCLILENVLSRGECKALLEVLRERHGDPEAAAYSTQPGSRSQFLTYDPELSSLLWERIRETLPAELDGGTAVGLMGVVAHARYFPGQVGFPHIDFRHGPRHPDPLAQDSCVASRISFTLYLDDDFSGGDLEFIHGLHLDGTHDGAHSRVEPRSGMAVVFYQGVKEFAHFPCAVQSGCKSILRADVLYRFPDGASADLGCLSVS